MVWPFPAYLLEYPDPHHCPGLFGSGSRDALMSLMRDAIGVLLAGGQGERLWPLTRDRAKPAVPFGGVYRIIDITLSNLNEMRRLDPPSGRAATCKRALDTRAPLRCHFGKGLIAMTP